VFGPLGIPELFVITVLVGFPLIGLGIAHLMLSHRRIAQFGHTSRWEYLQAVPRSDAEKKDAADLALRGLVLCILGVVFSPLVFIGLVPLFYGARKLAYALLGLGLLDDEDESRT
jgi:uncharacterized membrane protein